MKSLSVLKYYLILCAVQVLFGINFVTSKYALASLSPPVFTSLRFIASGLLLVAVAFLFRRQRPVFTPAFLKEGFWYALLGLTLTQLFFLFGLRWTTSTNAAIITTIAPLLTMGCVVIQDREMPTFGKMAGFFIAFIGVLSVRDLGSFSITDKTLAGDMLVLLGCVSLAVFLATSKRYFSRHGHLWASTLLFIMASLQLLPLFLLHSGELRLVRWDAALIGCVAFAIIGATLVPYFLSNWALANIAPGEVALFIYLQPVVAALAAWKFLGESVTVNTFVAGLLILIGMITVLNEGRKTPWIWTRRQEDQSLICQVCVSRTESKEAGQREADR